MGILSEIRRLVKQAALGMPTLQYKPMRPNEMIDAETMLGNGAWGIIGAGAGLAKKSIADRKWTIPIAPMSPMSPVITAGEDRQEGSWGDYLRAGWNVGHDNADLMSASMMEGAAQVVPFVKFKAPSRYADLIHEMKLENGMDPDDASSMRGMAGLAGSLAASTPVFGAATKGSKYIEMGIKASMLSKLAPRLAGIAAKAPKYALGWEMYGGKEFADAVKNRGDSLEDGDSEESGMGNGLPSWHSYSSPRNTVNSASINVN